MSHDPEETAREGTRQRNNGTRGLDTPVGEGHLEGLAYDPTALLCWLALSFSCRAAAAWAPPPTHPHAFGLSPGSRGRQGAAEL